MSQIDQLKVPFCPKVIPPVGWALASIVCFVTGGEKGSLDSGWFNQGLDYALYVRVVVILAEDLMARLENCGHVNTDGQRTESDIENFANPIDTKIGESEATLSSLVTSYMDLFKPVCQQQHLTDLLAIMGKEGYTQRSKALSLKELKNFGKLEFLDVAYFYSYLLRIFSILNPTIGPLPVLNMLSFSPGFLVSLWGVLESTLFPEDTAQDDSFSVSKSSGNKNDGLNEKKQKHSSKDESNKWVNVLHKFTGKSQSGADGTNLVDDQSRPSQSGEGSQDPWDVEPLKFGPEGISKDLSCLLHLFFATYSHLLLILDDIEFYEKQVKIYIFFEE